jgi:hypothetical protein
MGIKSSVDRAYQEKIEKEIEDGNRKNNTEWTLRGCDLPGELDLDPPLKI